MTDEHDQRLSYGFAQASLFADLMTDESGETYEAFKNTCRWAAIVYEKATEAGVSPVHAAIGIISGINAGLIQLLFNPPEPKG